MATLETYGRCKCGEFNPLSAVNCEKCGARLAWASAPRKAATSGFPVPPNSAVAGATPRAQAAQAGYWSAAISGVQSSGSAYGGSYNSDPDIDFTPMSPMTRPDHYCPSCGMGLSRSQDVCPRCRHMKGFNRADLRLSLMVGALIVTGFLLGVVWSSFLVTYLRTGQWPFQSSAPIVQPAPTRKAPTKAYPAPPRPDYSGIPGR